MVHVLSKVKSCFCSWKNQLASLFISLTNWNSH